jgi:hypothetical protein
VALGQWPEFHLNLVQRFPAEFDSAFNLGNRGTTFAASAKNNSHGE